MQLAATDRMKHTDMMSRIMKQHQLTSALHNYSRATQRQHVSIAATEIRLLRV